VIAEWSVVVIDSAEQEIPGPKNKRRRKSYYSGKKKKHTVKTQYMVNSDGTVSK
jgi:DDE superfamily endonuclease